ncbi:sensor histidine kinase [Nonomuraea sp. KM88]|uniref:sensor histidine kinase n=1 Tax=Nonomuraea sp. KM88 TaxID=3457427 RepID=UPI003FCE1CEB
MRISLVLLARQLSALDSRLLDGTLATALVVGSWAWETLEQGKGHPPTPLSMTLTVLVNAPLTWRRRAPFTVLIVSVGASLTYHFLGYHLGLNSIGPLVALYSVAAHASRKATGVGAVLVIAEWTHSSASQPGVALWSALGQSIIVAVWAVSTGIVVHLLVERGRQLAEERDAAARRAVVYERVRIARELHDVVAHHMSVISVQAGLGRYVALSDPATAHTTLGVIADASHEALAEVRRLLSILRPEAPDHDDETPYTTMPGLRSLDALVERMRAAGLTIRLTVDGEPRALPPGLDLCAYRIVQESLTNVLKHAGPAHVDIRLTYETDALNLRVTDDGPGAMPGARPDGHGLIGMTERVTLYGGVIHAGSPPGGGFDVLATFPLFPSEEGPLT